MKTRSALFAALVLTILLAAPFAAPLAPAQGSDATAKILALEASGISLTSSAMSRP